MSKMPAMPKPSLRNRLGVIKDAVMGRPIAYRLDLAHISFHGGDITLRECMFRRDRSSEGEQQ